VRLDGCDCDLFDALLHCWSIAVVQVLAPSYPPNADAATSAGVPAAAVSILRLALARPDAPRALRRVQLAFEAVNVTMRGKGAPAAAVAAGLLPLLLRSLRSPAVGDVEVVQRLLLCACRVAAAGEEASSVFGDGGGVDALLAVAHAHAGNGAVRDHALAALEAHSAACEANAERAAALGKYAGAPAALSKCASKLYRDVGRSADAVAAEAEAARLLAALAELPAAVQATTVARSARLMASHAWLSEGGFAQTRPAAARVVRSLRRFSAALTPAACSFIRPRCARCLLRRRRWARATSSRRT